MEKRKKKSISYERYNQRLIEFFNFLFEHKKSNRKAQEKFKVNKKDKS